MKKILLKTLMPLALVLALALLISYYYGRQQAILHDKLVVSQLQTIQNNIDRMSRLRKFQERAPELFKESKFVIGKDIKFLDEKIKQDSSIYNEDVHEIRQDIDKWNERYGSIPCYVFVAERTQSSGKIDLGNDAFLSLSNIEDRIRLALDKYRQERLDILSIIITAIATFAAFLSIYAFARESGLFSKLRELANKALQPTV